MTAAEWSDVIGGAASFGGYTLNAEQCDEVADLLVGMRAPLGAAVDDGLALVNSRNESHGDPLETALQFDPSDALCYPVAMIRAKLSRIAARGSGLEDSFADIAGYAAMAIGFLRR